MKPCAVLILVCLLAGQAPCMIVRRGALIMAIRQLQTEIQETLDFLNTTGLLPNESCLFINTTEVMGAEHDPLTAHNISSIICHLNNTIEMAPQVAQHLRGITQVSTSIEWALNGGMSNEMNSSQCSLPTIEGPMKKYLYVKCFLVSLKLRLSSAALN